MDVEREVVIGSFILYAWLLGRKSIDFWARIALWLPVVLSGVCYFRLEANRQRIRQLGAYLTDLESQLAHPALQGWEHVLGTIRTTHPDLSTSYYGWIGLLYFLFTAMVALAGTAVFYFFNRNKLINSRTDHNSG
jgi:hypothetical protein